MTIAQTIVELDASEVEAERIRALYVADDAAAIAALDRAGMQRAESHVVVVDAIRDCIRIARDGCEELS